MNMKIRINSDIHAEFYKTTPYTSLIAVGEDEASTTLVLAGDIALAGKGEKLNIKYKELLDSLVLRFKYVVFVTGNHEYYGSCIDKVDGWFQEYDEDNINFHFLNGSSVKLDGVMFVGGTLWTDFGEFNPLYMQDAMLFMSDYRLITVKQRKLKATDTYKIHKKHLTAIESVLHSDEERVVVVTHMLPSFECIDDCYKTSDNWSINYAFASHLDDLISKGKPDLWIYGHTHSSGNFNIGDTRMIANPNGYPDPIGDSGVLENWQCDPLLVVEV